MKNAYRLAALWLFAVMILGTSLPSLAAPRCEDLFPPEKEVVNKSGETLEEMTLRLAKAQSIELRIGKNRVIATNYIPAAKDQPTFEFLPGVNRSLSIDEPHVQMLARLGYGIITYDFSTQPLSVAKLGAGVKPYFLDSKENISLQSLAEETEMIAEQFRLMGVKNIIPVSLSFSGAVTPYLKGYPLIIETSPMTSTDAAKPEAAANIKKLRALEIFNPIFGPRINRTLIDQGYRQNWTAQVERISKGYDLPKDKAGDMVEGYLTMSRAAENFDWSQVDIPKETKRAFIIGENEAPVLFLSQAQAFLKLSRENKNVTFFLVGAAGHIVPDDQPAAYALILANVLGPQQYDVENLGGAVFDPVKKEFSFKVRKEMEQFLEHMIESIQQQLKKQK